MKLKAEESGFEKAHIPEGIHHAELVGATDAPDGQYGPRVALDFNVYYSKHEKSARIGRVFGKKLTPKSKLWEALTALGANLKIGKNVDIDEMKGNPCRVMVEDYKDDEGKTVSGINKVKAPDDKTIEYISENKAKFKKGADTDDGEEVEVEAVK